MKKVKLETIVSYLEEQVRNHSIYVYGAQGQNQITEAWIRRMEAHTGGTNVKGHYVPWADLAVEHWKKEVKDGYWDVLRAFDCSGLFMYLLQNLLGIYTHDKSANGIHSDCKDTTEVKKGYMVFRHEQDNPKHMTHVGMLVSDTEVIHCKGRQSGCVREDYSPNYWHVISIPPFVDFEEEPEPSPEPQPEPSHEAKQYVHPKGSVRVREGNGTEYKPIPPTANAQDYLPLLGQAEEFPNWYRVEWQGREGYISSKPRYTEVVSK